MPWPSQAACSTNWKAAVEPSNFGPQHQRQREIDQRDDQRDPARGGGDRRVGPRVARMTSAPDQRQEGDDAEEMAHDEVHGATPAITKNQVASATTPISMAKA